MVREYLTTVPPWKFTSVYLCLTTGHCRVVVLPLSPSFPVSSILNSVIPSLLSPPQPPSIPPIIFSIFLALCLSGPNLPFPLS